MHFWRGIAYHPNYLTMHKSLCIQWTERQQAAQRQHGLGCLNLVSVYRCQLMPLASMAGENKTARHTKRSSLREKAHCENIFTPPWKFLYRISHQCNQPNHVHIVWTRGTWHLWRVDVITSLQKELTVILMLKVETCYICLNRQQRTEPARSQRLKTLLLSLRCICLK